MAKILGIDYGEKHLGLAVSQGEIAEPYNRELKLGRNRELRIKEFCRDHEIEKIIIGLPEGRLKEEVKKFAASLEKITGLPVEFSDETLTTKEAEAKLKEGKAGRKKRKFMEHHAAAALVLQGYLEKIKEYA